MSEITTVSDNSEPSAAQRMQQLDNAKIKENSPSYLPWFQPFFVFSIEDYYQESPYTSWVDLLKMIHEKNTV